MLKPGKLGESDELAVEWASAAIVDPRYTPEKKIKMIAGERSSMKQNVDLPLATDRLDARRRAEAGVPRLYFTAERGEEGAIQYAGKFFEVEWRLGEVEVIKDTFRDVGVAV